MSSRFILHLQACGCTRTVFPGTAYPLPLIRVRQGVQAPPGCGLGGQGAVHTFFCRLAFQTQQPCVTEGAGVAGAGRN